MGTRRLARELALKVLFQIEFSPEKLKDLWPRFWEEYEADAEVHLFTQTLVEGTMRNLKEIDSVIERCSTNWKVSRMASVDRNILREATYEILYHEEIPASVTMNEAVEIAKKYGTEDSPSFINGILDKIAKEKVS